MEGIEVFLVAIISVFGILTVADALIDKKNDKNEQKGN